MPAPRSTRRAAASPDSERHPVRGTTAWLAVVRAYNQCDTVLAERLAAVGIRVPEHEILINLARAPGSTQQQLAQNCFVAKSGVSMLIAHMEKNGFVVRKVSSSDARVKQVYLTVTGERIARKSIQIQSKVVAAMAATLSDAQLEQIRDSMQRVSLQLEALQAKAFK